jgi:hypothetical protein
MRCNASEFDRGEGLDGSDKAEQGPGLNGKMNGLENRSIISALTMT